MWSCISPATMLARIGLTAKLRKKAAWREPLSYAFKKCENPPRIFVSASAIGFTATERTTEENKEGEGFFPVLHGRGLSEEGRISGAELFSQSRSCAVKTAARWKKCSRLSNSASAARLGKGKQWMGWIALDDLIKLFILLWKWIANSAINAVAPIYEQKNLHKKLWKSFMTILPIPAFAIKLMFGEMGETLLLERRAGLPKNLKTPVSV